MVRVNLQALVNNINLPTVIKTAILPGKSTESLFIATQVGEIFYLAENNIRIFLDIRPQVIRLGANGGYDERGLLGLAFHPSFNENGLFYLHYSLAGTQGPGALRESFQPNPCNTETLNLKWVNRETQFDHIDTVEEWLLQSNGQARKQRTLLNLRRPFMNHNGVNSLNFSPESGNLVLTTGDGGLGYDPFNLSQDDMEIAGKIIEIDVSKNVFPNNTPAVTRFNELTLPVQEVLSVIVKGVRNIPGISYQRYYNEYIKYVGNVGQDLEESIYSFIDYTPIPVNQLVQSYSSNSNTLNRNDFINLGWRGWEGIFPTALINICSNNSRLSQIIAYYDDAINVLDYRITPITTYFHVDPRPGKFNGIAVTGVQPYMGTAIPDLTGSVLFTDFSGVLAHTKLMTDFKLNEYEIIEINNRFNSQGAFYTCLGTNMNQTKIYLGAYASPNVTNYNQGTIYEIIP